MTFSSPSLRRRRWLQRWLARLALASGAIMVVAWRHSMGQNAYVAVHRSSPTGNARTMHHHQHVASSNWGRLWLAYVSSEVERSADPAARQTRWYWGAGNVQEQTEYAAPRWLQQLGIDWRNFSRGGGGVGARAVPVYVERMVSLPYWLPTLMAIGTAWFIGRADRRERRRDRRGLCPACGYDVRATPQRCPECGYVSGAAGCAAPASASA